MGALSDKVANATYPTREVVLSLDGQLATLRDSAMRELTDGLRVQKDVPEGGDAKGAARAVRAAKKRIDDLDEQMRDAIVRIRFTGLPFKKYTDLVRAHPPRRGKNEQFNPETLYLALARRSGELIESDGTAVPLDADDWDALEGVLTDGELGVIMRALSEVNSGAGRTGVGFLSRVSATTDSSAETSE